MKQYQVITLTHKELNISELGRYVIPSDLNSDQSESYLAKLKNHLGFKELMYLPTCNRICFFYVHDKAPDENVVKELFKLIHPNLPEKDFNQVASKAVCYSGQKAIRHLFEMASSLDSMVVGEREILRQFRYAYELCRQLGLTGDDIRLAVEFTIKLAKDIYTKTQIGEKPVSIVSLAARTIRDQQLPEDSRFLLVGAGQTITLMSKFLLKYGFTDFYIYNRREEKAITLANSIGGLGKGLDQLAQHKNGFDVLISCTASDDYVVFPEIYDHLMPSSDKGMKLIIDLAVPNDIHPEISQRDNVKYIQIEDLRGIAAENLAFRLKEVEKAKQLIEIYLEEFGLLYKQRQLEKALSEIPGKVREIRHKAVGQVFQKELAELDQPSKEVIHKILDYLEKKYIAIPVSTAKKAFRDGFRN